MALDWDRALAITEKRIADIEHALATELIIRIAINEQIAKENRK